jgi:hypothetical protein
MLGKHFADLRARIQKGFKKTVFFKANFIFFAFYIHHRYSFYIFYRLHLLIAVYGIYNVNVTEI